MSVVFKDGDRRVDYGPDNEVVKLNGRFSLVDGALVSVVERYHPFYAMSRVEMQSIGILAAEMIHSGYMHHKDRRIATFTEAMEMSSAANKTRAMIKHDTGFLNPLENVLN